jgi:hypothetical protein
MTNRGAGCGKAACPVLGGAGEQLGYGKDLVAPPRKQAGNRENKHFPAASGGSCLLERGRHLNSIDLFKLTLDLAGA